jgi:hypothetical protein
MKTTCYFTILYLIIATATAGAQDYRRTGTYIRPTISRDSRNTYPEWNDRSAYTRKSAAASWPNDDYYENTGYPCYVTVTSLPVRSAPAYDAPVLTTIPCGEVIHLANEDHYPWKSMTVNYFDSDEWKYKTTVGYVNSEYVRSPASPSNRPGTIDNRPNLAYRQEIRPAARPVNDRTYIARPTVNRAQIEKPGRITIWTDCDDDGHIDVYVDGQYAGTLTTCFRRAEPSFGADGTVVRELLPGKHTITARGSSKTWIGEVTVSYDQSIRKLLSAW